jgi:hypothetical protein
MIFNKKSYFRETNKIPMKKLLKEPLFHFLLLGLGLFILFGWVSDRTDSAETIVIDDYDMNNLIASWEMQWKRLPTHEELKSLVDQNIRQEVLYQEALKMNLDHNDQIIKRRLAQKMKFLSNDLATVKDPSGEELQAYLDENLEEYMLPAVYSLYQVSFSHDYHKNPKEKALISLEKLNGLDPESAEKLGDPLPFEFLLDKVDVVQLDRIFGMNFTKGLEVQSLGTWSGPVRSGYGWHLVYITEKKPPEAPEFEMVKNALKRDFEYENQKKVNDQIFYELKKNYEVIFELDPEKFDQAYIDFLNGLENEEIE